MGFVAPFTAAVGSSRFRCCTALRLACHGVKFESFGNGTKRIQAHPFQWPLGDVCELGGAVDTAEKLGNGQSDRCLISCLYSGLCTILRLEGFVKSL